MKLFFIVDSQLAKETNIGVQEMVNGCLCCVLVGQMKLALQELKGKAFSYVIKGRRDFCVAMLQFMVVFFPRQQIYQNKNLMIFTFY